MSGVRVWHSRPLHAIIGLLCRAQKRSKGLNISLSLFFFFFFMNSLVDNQAKTLWRSSKRDHLKMCTVTPISKWQVQVLFKMCLVGTGPPCWRTDIPSFFCWLSHMSHLIQNCDFWFRTARQREIHQKTYFWAWPFFLYMDTCIEDTKDHLISYCKNSVWPDSESSSAPFDISQGVTRTAS